MPTSSAQRAANRKPRANNPADSPNIVESKSFKPTHPFNQTRLDEAELTRRLIHDLSVTTGKPVSVEIIPPERFFAAQRIADADGYCIDNLDIDADYVFAGAATVAHAKTIRFRSRKRWCRTC